MKFTEVAEKVDNITEAVGKKMLQYVSDMQQQGANLEELGQEDLQKAVEPFIGEVLQGYSKKEQVQLLNYSITVFASQFINGVIEAEVQQVVEAEPGQVN